MDRRQFAAGVIVAAAAAAPGSPPQAAKPPESWDGLSRVPSKRVKYVYLLPGADFRGYHKVMLDPTEIAFRKDWARDYNNTATTLSSRVNESDVQKIVDEGGRAATQLFVDAYTAGGYPVVAAPAHDVLRIRTGIVNLSVTAPDRPTTGRSYSFAQEAGYATLIIEARDSMTNALLGRAVDGRVAGDTSMLWRNKVTNRADFRVLGKAWAKASVDGLNELKKLSPIQGG